MSTISKFDLLRIASEQMAGMQAPGYPMLDRHAIADQAIQCALALVDRLGFEVEKNAAIEPGDWVEYKGRDNYRFKNLTRFKKYQVIGTRHTASGQRKVRVNNNTGKPAEYPVEYFDLSDSTTRVTRLPYETDVQPSDLGQFT